jgi:hypothetical protein
MERGADSRFGNGHLSFAEVLTATPTYTAATGQPLSQNASGQLRTEANLASGSSVGISQTTPGTTDRVTVGGLALVDVTLTADTGAMGANQIIADTQVVTNAMRVADYLGKLVSVSVIDEDDQGAALDLYFFDANVSMGTENEDVTISDANARSFLTKVAIATGDYTDLGGVRVAALGNLARLMKPATGTRNVYVAAVNGAGTPTYTASGLKLRLGFEQT